jgi:hypothetical protein
MSSSAMQIQVSFEADPEFEGSLYAILGSTIAWCCVITLAVSAFQAKFKESDTYSTKRRRFLLCYVTLMTGISTAALLQHILLFRCQFMMPTCQGIYFPFLAAGVFPTIFLAIVGADLLMVRFSALQE